MNQIDQVTTWIDAAKQEPGIRNIANYLAYTISEIGEGLAAINHPDCQMLSLRLEGFSKAMRNGMCDEAIAACDKVELLDSACDTQWTAIGLAHMLADAEGAFGEVADSNYSKFENGVCVLDETGKVVKGPSYFKPNLAKYLRTV